MKHMNEPKQRELTCDECGRANCRDHGCVCIPCYEETVKAALRNERVWFENCERAQRFKDGCDGAGITHPEHLAELLNAVEMSDEPRMNAAFNALVATS